MTGVKLYELSEARDILDQFLLEEDGVETPEIADLFAQLAGAIDEKVERTALWIKEREAEAAAIKLEEQRLAQRRKVIENRVDRTKRYLELQLEQLGRDKVNGLLVTVALQRNPPSLKGDLMPSKLRELHDAGSGFVTLVPSTYALDRRAVLNVWKTDPAQLPDGLTVEQGRSLRIR